jgi:hypothetical protein
MTGAVNTIRDGQSFQARIFWINAVKLFDIRQSVVRVGFESGPRGFDDVWVEYQKGKARQDQFGNPLLLERFQCKWHVANGTFSHLDLIRPEYIGATKKSLLQRAWDAHVADQAGGLPSRIKLLTNHRAHPEDVLHKVIHTGHHTLKLDDFFSGKTKASAFYTARASWLQHLGIDEAALRTLCASLAFSSYEYSLDDLRQQMDVAFAAHGLKQTDPKASSTVYDDIPYKWLSQGRLEFDALSLRKKCEDEGLLAESALKPEPKVFGVKSFEHAFDRLEDRCDEHLNLVSSFDDRYIHTDSSWQQDLSPRLAEFMRTAALSGNRVRLALDAHATLAFAAGSFLDTKSGRIVEFQQRTRNGVVTWAPDDAMPSDSWSKWTFSEHDLKTGGAELAVAVSLTRPTESDVRAFILKNPAIGSLLIATPASGPSQNSVACGSHADSLAETLGSEVNAVRARVSTSRASRMHLFIAAPNGFTFYLGRHIKVLQPVTLYEFDFGGGRSGCYEPSLSMPNL